MLPGTHGPWGDGGRAAAVTHPVHEDPAVAAILGGNVHECRRTVGHEPMRDELREPGTLLPRDAPFQRHGHMHTLATAQLHPAGQSRALQQFAHAHRALAQRLPRDAGARVEVENHAIGRLEILRTRAPHMKLEHVHLHQCHQITRLMRDGVVCFLCRRLCESHGAHRHVTRGRPVFLEEAFTMRTVWASHGGNGAIVHMRQHQRCNALHIVGEFSLGELQFRIHHAVTAADLDAGDHICRFLAHVTHLLVLADAEERGLPQQVIGGPFSEGHVCHDARFHPARAACHGRRHRHARRLALNGAQRLVQYPEHGFRKTRTDRACIAQCVAGLWARGQQQRAEVGARPLRFRVADHDQLIAIAALDLQPIA